MSDFTVVVVVDDKNVTATTEEQSIVVNPLSDSVIEVISPVSEVAVEEQTVKLDIIQHAPFTVEIVENKDCCDLENVDIPKLSVSKIYAEPISALQLVSATSSTQVGVADVTTLAEATVLGIATIAGTTLSEERITILGVVEDASFTYPVNTPLFLGAGGTITDTPTTTVGQFVTQIGYSLGSGAIFISISEPAEII